MRRKTLGDAKGQIRLGRGHRTSLRSIFGFRSRGVGLDLFSLSLVGSRGLGIRFRESTLRIRLVFLISGSRSRAGWVQQRESVTRRIAH